MVPNVFKNGSLINKLLTSSSYDFIFFLSDGSVPSTLARYNILNFQVPFPHVPMTPWKRFRYQAVICYSEFTKKRLDSKIGIPVKIFYPPVDIDTFKIKKKEKIVLSVGRFNSLYGAKKHDILIEIFKKAVQNKTLPGWKLILAGGVLDTDKEYFAVLQKMAKGFPIEFYPNCSFVDLKRLYGSASIYWHGAGYGETDPQHMEHFGITTVEAMASGCIPIVYNAGGQPEIVDHGKNGFLWNTKEECLDLTKAVIHSFKLQKELQHQALAKAKIFSTANFCQKFDELLDQITNKQC
jgi:glycosyltransferase involved in cell wall biosynthesis